MLYWGLSSLTHWGRVTHICVGKLTIIGSDNGLSPERRQAIIWTNAGILLTGPLGTNFGEILIEIQTFSSKKIRLKMSSAKCCSFDLGLNVLSHQVSSSQNIDHTILSGFNGYVALVAVFFYVFSEWIPITCAHITHCNLDVVLNV